MDQILPRLYLGDYEDAARVTPAECQCILTLCEQAPSVAEGITHIHAAIPDEVYLPASVWSELVHVLQVALRDYATVLVHCRLGKSRSPSLLAAYLARTGWTLETALALLVACRGIVAPHEDTWRGVREYIGGRVVV